MAVNVLVCLRLVLPALVLGALFAAVAPQDARADRHAGYYYPPAVSTEIYKARAVPMAEASRQNRIKFVVGLTQQMLPRKYTTLLRIQTRLLSLWEINGSRVI